MTGLTLVIGNQNYSSWSLRPWLFLAHHEIPFNIKKVKLFTESMATDLAVHFSDTKVPVLLDGELEVWDSLAILEYLAERFPEKQGWPKSGQREPLHVPLPLRCTPACSACAMSCR